MPNCTWEFRRSETSPSTEWANDLGVSPLIVQLLAQRGITTRGAMDAFLSPGLRHLPPLSDWHGLDTAASLLTNALAAGKQLAVWGDYDVDGVSASALLIDFFRQHGINVMSYIPDRMGEGYGLNSKGIEELAAAGVQTLITVDCGITSFDEIARAKELGMTVVVTDHHLPEQTLPAAHAILNPRIGDCPSQDLAGVGVAFLLAASLNKKLPGSAVDIRQFLDLVALGTIADVVKLTGINRILVKNGLLMLSEAKRPGIFALKEASGLPPTASMGSGNVAFGLAPRLNAAGRLGSPDLALKLLLTQDHAEARTLAQQLDQMNSQRRKEEETIQKEAAAQAKEQLHRMGLVLYAPHWHQGIIGIVASRLMEQFHRPVLILCRDGELIKGSGRSIPSFDLHQGLTACADLLEGFGGHPQAAGLRLKEARLEALRDRFDQAVRDVVGTMLPRRSLTLDGELPFAKIDQQLVKELDLLQPFGLGNPQPLFSSPLVTVTTYRTFKDEHVSLALKDSASGMTFWGKAWRLAGQLRPDVKGKDLRFAFTPRFNHYNGVTSIDLTIKDWQEK